MISVPPTMGTMQLLANGQTEWQLTGTPGDAYVIEASSNMVDWVPAASLTNTTGILLFTDPTAANQPQRFYRARLIP